MLRKQDHLFPPPKAGNRCCEVASLRRSHHRDLYAVRFVPRCRRLPSYGTDEADTQTSSRPPNSESPSTVWDSSDRAFSEFEQWERSIHQRAYTKYFCERDRGDAA